MADHARLLVPALLLAGGLTAGGLMAGRGFAEARLGDRFVTVKGVAEREVEADLAVWTLQFSAGGNDLVAVQRTIARNLELMFEFLERHDVRVVLGDDACNPQR